MRLIDADELMDELENEQPLNWTDSPGEIQEQADWERFKGMVSVANTIEAEPVRHGRWIIEKSHTVSRNPYMDDNYFASATCSECGFCIHAETRSFGYPDLNTTNYCPNCGAKMQGGSDE